MKKQAQYPTKQLRTVSNSKIKSQDKISSIWVDRKSTLSHGWKREKGNKLKPVAI